MKGDELRQVRERLGLTQKGLGEKLGVHTNTVARWERNEVGISEPAARLVRLLLKQRTRPKGRR